MLGAVMAQHEASVGSFRLLSRCHPGRRLEEDYILTAESLGVGASGHVLLASSRHAVGKQVAVKSFVLRKLSQVERSLLEVEVSVSLTTDHPHMVRVLDVYEVKGRLHLVMERMEGGELFDAVVESAFSEHRATGAIQQILSAIAYMHSKGIVHRDLKLENIMFQRADGERLKLMDFGLSSFLKRGFLEGSCGTNDYMAPEVWDDFYTEQCDIWSLGVLAYTLLSGNMPFSGTVAEIRQKVAKGKYTLEGQPWCGFSAEARDFIQSLLQVNPALRPSAQMAFAHPWLARTPHPPTLQPSTIAALSAYPSIAPFKRLSLKMMAMSLPCVEEEAMLSQFMALDRSRRGVISLQDLKVALAQNCSEKGYGEEEIFAALCGPQASMTDNEISYSDFLAVMIPTCVVVNNDSLRVAFRKFDVDASGTATAQNLKSLLSSSAEDAEALVREANSSASGAISFPEFAHFMRADERRGQISRASASRPLALPILLGSQKPADGAKTPSVKTVTWDGNIKNSPASRFGPDMLPPNKNRSCGDACTMM